MLFELISQRRERIGLFIHQEPKYREILMVRQSFQELPPSRMKFDPITSWHLQDTLTLANVSSLVRTQFSDFTVSTDGAQKDTAHVGPADAAACRASLRFLQALFVAAVFENRSDTYSAEILWIIELGN